MSDLVSVVVGGVIGFVAATGRDIIGGVLSMRRERQQSRDEETRQVRRAASLISEELASAHAMLMDAKAAGTWWDPHQGRILPAETWNSEKGTLAEAGRRKAYEAASTAYVAMNRLNWRVSEWKNEGRLDVRPDDGLDRHLDAVASARVQLGRLIGSD
jgi:hypothetical protein